MKISTFTLEIEHEADEDPVGIILKAIEFRSYYGDWIDFIDTKDSEQMDDYIEENPLRNPNGHPDKLRQRDELRQKEGQG